MATGRRKFGDFCWMNMLTPDPPAARDFYAKVLGWTYGEIPGLGNSVRVGGSEIGGLFDLAGPNSPPGTPPVIGVMIKVESADKTAEKVAQLGGTAMPPFDIMQEGRMAVCFDPNGANFDVWEPKQGHGTSADTTHHGVPSWFETITSDVDRARSFYAELFGWTAEEMPMPDFTYTTFKNEGQYVAGMMPILPHMGNCPSHWGTYFTVDDVDASEKLAKELGATVCIPAQDIPNVGRFAALTSPQGVMFYVITYVK